jgi:hypothetical protein
MKGLKMKPVTVRQMLDGLNDQSKIKNDNVAVVIDSLGRGWVIPEADISWSGDDVLASWTADEDIDRGVSVCVGVSQVECECERECDDSDSGGYKIKAVSAAYRELRTGENFSNRTYEVGYIAECRENDPDTVRADLLAKATADVQRCHGDDPADSASVRPIMYAVRELLDEVKPIEAALSGLLAEKITTLRTAFNARYPF